MLKLMVDLCFLLIIIFLQSGAHHTNWKLLHICYSLWRPWQAGFGDLSWFSFKPWVLSLSSPCLSLLCLLTLALPNFIWHRVLYLFSVYNRIKYLCWLSIFCRHVLFPRIVLLSRCCSFAASQLLYLPYQSSRTWGLWICLLLYDGKADAPCFSVNYSDC